MMKVSLFLLAFLALAKSQELPTAYEYFTEGGITSGLIAENKEFRLNGKYIKILSTGLQFFRIHPSQWRHRLKQLRALGANTVETYIPWNIIEPRKDQFDFGQGKNDFSDFANVTRFLDIAQEEDFFILLRPGPFINAEWDWGGLPSWLQHGDKEMKVRMNYAPYLERVKIYFDAVLSILKDYQFTRGKSIIAIQAENEYAAMEPRSTEYLQFIEQCFLDNEFSESLIFTSDHRYGDDGFDGAVPGRLQTANTHDPDDQFVKLQSIQPDMPLIAMEYYTGWLTHWDETPGTREPEEYIYNLDRILGEFNGSANLYVTTGGTSFGFMSGSNTIGNAPYYNFVVTSYDFDAVITEAGDYTVKYNMTLETLEKYENPKLSRPERPETIPKMAYPTLPLRQSLNYDELIEQIPASKRQMIQGSAISMEDLDINDGSGQSYGYIVYRIRRQITSDDVLTISYPHDFTQILLDNYLIDNGIDNDEYFINSVKNFNFNITTEPAENVLDILVENMGRVNFGNANELVCHKGIAPIYGGKLELNSEEVQGMEIISMEFNNAWVKSIERWRLGTQGTTAPCAFKTTFNIDTVTDTFLDMRDWHKGIVFVNGFNVGRYFRVGPQRTLYVPAALLNQGSNDIIIYEQIQPANEIKFIDVPILGYGMK